MSPKKIVLFFSALLLVFLLIQVAVFNGEQILQNFKSSKNPEPQTTPALTTTPPPTPTPSSLRSIFKTIPKIDPNFAYQKIIEYEELGSKAVFTETHDKTFEWIKTEMEKNTDLVQAQIGEMASMFSKEWPLKKASTIPIKNVIAQINPKAKKHILLFTPWDNYPTANKDPLLDAFLKTYIGTNNGGSGVSVLMAMAKALKPHQQELAQNDLGISFIFLDAQDVDASIFTTCMGSQYWSKHETPKPEQILYGIYMHRVGKRGAKMSIEAKQGKRSSGLGGAFMAFAQLSGNLNHFETDYVPTSFGCALGLFELDVPLVNITASKYPVDYTTEWRTFEDTSDIISRETLEAVANTVLYAIAHTPSFLE